MVNISIDVTDLGGEARPGDKVVLWKPAAAGSSSHAGRVISTAPVDVFLTNGKASVPDVEPGDMRVILQCRGVESQGPIHVTVPDGNGTVTLRSLIESQFEYAPPIVSAVQEAAANASASEEAAIRAQVRSERAADRADAKVDDAINNGANLVRNEVKQDADRAVSARQAAVQSESNAAASENAAASSASNAAASESAAKQSETNAGDYAAVATTAATEAVDAMGSVSDIIGANYATQEYVDSSKWNQGALSAAQVGTLDNAPDGFSTVGSVNQARELQAPFEAATVIGTFRFSGVAYQIGIARVDMKMRLVARFYSASGWRAWQEFEGPSQPPTPVETGKPPSSGSGFKTVPVSVTVGNSGTTHLATTGSYRFPLLNNAPITRWRLCATTRRPRQGDLSGADVTLTKVAYGDHAENGAFTNTPTVVAESINIPADGSIIKLPWVSGEFGAGVERLISLSYTSNSDVGPLSLHGYCFDMGTADAADQAATGTPRGSGPLDMWIEAETYATTPVIAAIGDSTTASSGATRTTYDGWLNLYCREKSALPVHYAAAGDTAQNWLTQPEGYKATRWLDLDAPDAIIYNLGSNDVGGGAILETMQQRVSDMMPILETISPNVYGATLKPRTGQDPAQVTVRKAYNSWLLSTLGVFRDIFDFNAATVAADGESLLPEYNSGDDTHLNSAGYVALAGAIHRPVTTPPVVTEEVDALAAYNRGKGL